MQVKRGVIPSDDTAKGSVRLFAWNGMGPGTPPGFLFAWGSLVCLNWPLCRGRWRSVSADSKVGRLVEERLATFESGGDAAWGSGYCEGWAFGIGILR